MEMKENGRCLLCMHLIIFFLIPAAIAAEGSRATSSSVSSASAPLKRGDFPPGLTFGLSSAAYQIEGAWDEDGRKPSIWDTFTHQHPEKIADRSTGDKALDSYHRYKEDASILQNMGADGYRFSISWPRILPNGNLRGGINWKAIQHYNDQINDLLSKGLQPFVTLFHWDLPQALEDEYLGFLSPRVIDDYRDYVDVCFQQFGDRVKHWITLNEPYSFAQRGYASGMFAPARCSSFDGVCFGGNSSTEPYIVMHHLILSHAAAVELYRAKYQATQKGQIGVTLVTHWFTAYSNSKSDLDAAARTIDFFFGWFMDPIVTGDYPFSMRAVVGDRLPAFTAQQVKLIKGSYDFLGLNYYSTYYARSESLLAARNISYNTDNRAILTGIRNGIPIGPQANGSDWLFVYPKGLRDLLVYIKSRYQNPTIYITENGYDDLMNLPLNVILDDNARISFHEGHLVALHDAIREGVNVKGYFAWGLYDFFEWDAGYTVGFGFYHVDKMNNFKRYPKKSSYWLRNFLKK